MQREDKVAEPWAGLHDLRKTCLTRWAQVLPMHVLKQFAGHSSITTTANHYLATTNADAIAARAATVAARKIG